ncbi:hypothetical protein V5799_020430 [Amblyomma americanum]|uniref:GH18 domain-containing protein n=1 Tax=Amblyomma americanum TaxID=6943 RepID=A0AAQ4EUG3_AMBAM
MFSDPLGPASPTTKSTRRSGPETRLGTGTTSTPDPRAIASASPAAFQSPSAASSRADSQHTQDVIFALSPYSTQAPPGDLDLSTGLQQGASVDLQFRALPREAEETPQDERFCIRIWVLCAALAFPLVLSSWLFLVPYFVHNNRAQVPAQPAFPVPPGPPVPAPVPAPVTVPGPAPGPASAPPPGSTMSTTTATVDPWAGVPASCLRPAVLPRLPTMLRVGPPYAPQASSHPTGFAVFCLYNITRIDTGSVHHNSSQWHFLFGTLPFQLCPNLIYWSVGIDNGTITSRYPSFDRHHGLSNLRTITDNAGFRDIKILLALGGYPEDAPHFSRLGRDNAALDRLKRSVTSAMTTFRLDGVTVHWAEPRAGCAGVNDTQVLALLLRSLRQEFQQSGMPRAIVSVMVSANGANGLFLDAVADVVDYFFLATNELPLPASTAYDTICSDVSNSVVTALRDYARLTSRVRHEQLCITERLTPWLTTSRWNARLSRYDPPQITVDRAFYSFCNQPRFCRREQLTGACIVHHFGSLSGMELYHASTNSAATLRDRVDFNLAFNLTGSPSPKRVCVLVLNLDDDNYADQCGQGYNRYLLMRNLYFVMVGQSQSIGSIAHAAPRC